MVSTLEFGTLSIVEQKCSGKPVHIDRLGRALNFLPAYVDEVSFRQLATQDLEYTDIQSQSSYLYIVVRNPQPKRARLQS